MYLPAHFAVDDPKVLHRIIREHPLGLVVSHGAQGLDAEHLPFEFDADSGPWGVLRAHVARSNAFWQQCPTGTTVMVVFRGVQGYISPGWYPSKHETHRQVPTWNYEAVHAHGTVTVHDDERFVRGLVGRLTRRHEQTQAQPWRMGDSPPDYIDAMLQAIVGIEIQITSVVGKAKLGQNKEARDRLGAARALEDRGQEDLAALMRQAGPAQG